MSRQPLTLAVVVLSAAAVCVPATALAQIPANVRVVEGPARIERWFRGPVDVMLEVEAGTTLEVLDKERDWFWVIVPPDGHGTRRAGWIRAGDVEPAPPAARRPRAAAAGALASATPAAPAGAEDRVTITERASDPAADRAKAAAAARAYAFEDVHFDRDRYSLRADEIDALRGVVAALKADPALALNIEGYTCNLGTPAYNLALGLNRANAVKNYLVSEGIAADRLHTIGLCEEHAKHDNSREETRQLNRRVALVPGAQP